MARVYAILQWRAGDDPITRADAYSYVEVLSVVFGTAHDPAALGLRAAEPMDGQFVNMQRFLSLVTDAKAGFGLFEVLPLLAKPLT